MPKNTINEVLNSLNKHGGAIRDQILNKYSPLSKEEEKTASDKDLVIHNLRFMITQYKKYLSKMTFSEYISEIIAAMYFAAGKFDRSRNIRFTTYANPWVRVFLQNYTQKDSSILSFNPMAFKKIAKLKKYLKSFENENNRFPTKEEFIRDTSGTEKLYNWAQFYIKSFKEFSIDNNINPNETNSVKISDTIAENEIYNYNKEGITEEIDKSDLLQFINNKINTLPNKEKNIINSIYFKNIPKKTVAQQFNLSIRELNNIINNIFSDIKSSALLISN